MQSPSLSHAGDRVAVEQHEQDRRHLVSCVEEFTGYQEAPSFREISESAMSLQNAVIVFALSSKNSRVALWQVAVALGMRVCDGENLDDLARKEGVTRQCLSKGSKEFQRALRLPLSPGMRDSAGACAEARERQLS